MELEFLDDAAPELSSWITNPRGYLFEEQPRARQCARSSLHAADADEELDDWSDSEDA
jgi:hypothetical protein